MHALTITAISAITPRMRHITLAGPSLLGVEVTPAQDVEVIISEAGGPRVKRRYTVRRARPGVGEFDIDALVHPHGPGGRWATAARVGDGLELLGPRGHLELRAAAWHLFIGDEAALPAFAAIIEALAVNDDAVVLAEVGDASDEVDLGRAQVTWLHRGNESPGGVDLYRAALAELAVRADGRAYLLGESRAMVALRPSIEALGITSERAYVKGYWNLGRGSRRVPPS
jgi:NADPH-dependent ferric siderophore reductase